MSHLSVMSGEVIEFLEPSRGGIYVDATLGGCGHTIEILERGGPETRVIGLDCDADAIERAKERLAPYGDRVTIVRENFGEINSVLSELAPDGVDGIIADIGLSSFQLDDGARGFSFSKEAPLDMRMDKRLELTARELINELEKDELKRIFREYGEERFAGKIAAVICKRRIEKEIETTGELRAIVSETVPPPRHYMKKRIDPATRVFQALRIAVNDELGALKRFLDALPQNLKKGGRVVIISFHSLEDRLVKRAFRVMAADCLCPPRTPGCICGHVKELKLLTRRVVKPTDEEVLENPRSRSAKLRAAERV